MSSPLPSVMLVIFWQGQSLYLFPMTKLSGRSRYSQLQSSLVAFIRSQEPRLREIRDLLLVKSQNAAFGQERQELSQPLRWKRSSLS